MKTTFKKSFTLYKYLSIIFTITFWIYILYDDFIFIEKYGLRFELILSWLAWFLIYFLGFSIYFWVIISILILVYHKLIKRS